MYTRIYMQNVFYVPNIMDKKFCFYVMFKKVLFL